MTTLAAWDDEAVLEEALAAPRRSYFPMPDLRAIESPGWLQLVTRSFKDGAFNGVALSVLSEGEADAVIDRTIAEYRALGLKFRWTVDPESRPRDLAARLERRGLKPSAVVAMARLIDGHALGADAAGVTVVDVDESTVGAFNAVMARGWSVDPAPLARAHEYLFAIPDRTQHLFLAYRDGVPAGVASYVHFPRSAYLLGAVVLPEHRNAGVYLALTRARLAHAHRRGATLATSQAEAETSAPILARLGFVAVCRFLSFHG